MDQVRISKTLMRRLPGYLEYLKSLHGEDCNVSATAIAGALGLGEVQVRKDLAKIAGEGRCRTGRSRDQLIRNIENAMSHTLGQTSILVGTGDLGRSLLEDSILAGSGVSLMACFDLEPRKTRTEWGKPVYSINRLESFCKHYNVGIGIIAVPCESAQSVCDGLVACGIRDIWNFSPASLRVPQGVSLRMPEIA